MSIFGKIMSAIFGTSAEAAPKPVDSATTPSAGPGDPSVAVAPSVTSTLAPATIDVTDILDKAVAKKGEKLQWRMSIVDLMKALDLDSSLSARKELAAD